MGMLAFTQGPSAAQARNFAQKISYTSKPSIDLPKRTLIFYTRKSAQNQLLSRLLPRLILLHQISQRTGSIVSRRAASYPICGPQRAYIGFYEVKRCDSHDDDNDPIYRPSVDSVLLGLPHLVQDAVIVSH